MIHLAQLTKAIQFQSGCDGDSTDAGCGSLQAAKISTALTSYNPDNRFKS
jgi:hypothetical protein